jgi:small-conductance mechanosensitive channel/CRP-like cAMP-binding protein
MLTLLLLATLVICAAVAVPLAAPRLPFWARVGWRLLSLLLLSVLAHRIVGSPVQPVLYPGAPWERVWQQLVVVGWWIMAARLAADAAHLILRLRHRSRETKILSDLIGGGIYVAAAFALIDIVFAVPIGGLIATSGVVAVVIGLALQSTLSDVFSGIAIDLERPYRAGDLLWVEGGIEGRVQEVNWRSTLVITGKGDVATIPNSVMAKSRLVNHSLPGPLRRVTVEVRLDPRVMPERCRVALEAAVRACLLPLATPAPSVHLTTLQGDGATYEIAFSVPSSESLAAAQSELLAQVQRHLFHAAIPMAVGGVAEAPALLVPGASDLITQSDVIGHLRPDERDTLAGEMVDVSFDEGESLFKQGDPVEALYLVLAGTVGIVRQQTDGTELHRRMSPGSCLGLVGLVTGSPFAASARALTSVKAFRLGKDGLTRAIQAKPELLPSLESLARRIQSSMKEDTGVDEDHRAEQVEAFQTRIRLFLRRLIGDGRERTAV